MNILIQESIGACHQLLNAIAQLHPHDYQRPSTALGGASWGKHLRHIIEFYTQLRQARLAGVVNYDERVRDEQLEMDPNEAQAQLGALVLFLQEPQEDQVLAVAADVFVSGSLAASSWHRELLNAYEHMVHHMAILRIASLADFPYVSFPASFGVSYATKRHQKTI